MTSDFGGLESVSPSDAEINRFCSQQSWYRCWLVVRRGTASLGFPRKAG